MILSSTGATRACSRAESASGRKPGPSRSHTRLMRANVASEALAAA